MRIKLSSKDNPLWNKETIQSIHIELTDKCNSGCPMCPRYVDFGTGVNPRLPLTQITLEQFKEWFPPEFICTLQKFYACGNYGDPIIASDCLSIFQYVRDNNNQTGLAMHTNAAARDAKWWFDLGKIMNNSDRGDYCVFSIDGLSDTNHLYRRNTNFERILENVKSYISAGGVAHWDYIVFEHNEHQIEEARHLAKALGFENFNLKRTTRWTNYRDGQGEYPAKNKKGEVEYYLRQPKNEKWKDSTFKILKQNLQAPTFITEQEFDKLEHDDLVHIVSNPAGGIEHIKYNDIEVVCRATKGPYNRNHEIFVSSSGHVYPCCFLGGEVWRHDANGGTSSDNYLKMIELNGGIESISLQAHSLSDIIESPIYSDLLARSFQKGHSMRSRMCSTCCGKQWNKLDYGELGAKNSSYFNVEQNTDTIGQL
jgi:MoaA/NifB/PqqE/SkfB family radical SAM enzyme